MFKAFGPKEMVSTLNRVVNEAGKGDSKTGDPWASLDELVNIGPSIIIDGICLKCEVDVMNVIFRFQ
jgi:hypothetical protein